MNPASASHLARDFARVAQTAERQARGIVAKGVDAGAAKAKSDAKAKWTRSGEASGASAESIRARMSIDDTTTGHIFVDGGGAFQETGTGHHPPNPVLHDAAEVAAEVVVSKAPEIVSRLARW